LGNLLDLNGFEYVASDEVRDELRHQVGDNLPDPQSAWQVPSSLGSLAPKGWQRITEMPIYSVDALVRRATALQRTLDAANTAGVHINAKAAAQVNLTPGKPAKVKQNGATVTLPVVIDERVPDNSALIYAGQLAHIDLGHWHGEIELSAI
jgi:NADH-quinone oxidoreductase subunit G